MVDENLSRAGQHEDPPGPMPALVCGASGHRWCMSTGVWEPVQAGGWPRGAPTPLTHTYISWWGLTTVLPCHPTPPTHIFPSGWPRDPITSHPHIYTLVGVAYGPPLPHHSTHSHIPKWLLGVVSQNSGTPPTLFPSPGGRLYAADGLWEAGYGPLDAVLMDGNCTHGVSTLCDLPMVGPLQPKQSHPAPARPELKRFSLILFSTFLRKLEGIGRSARWQEAWRAYIPWRPGCNPHSAKGPRRPSKRPLDEDFNWG